MRWRQDRDTGEMVPVDAAAAKHDSRSATIAVNNFDAFVSPVDGALIRNPREYREHNIRNNVVNAAEFSPEYYKEKAKEREAVFTGQRPKEETLQIKREMYERIMHAERQNG